MRLLGPKILSFAAVALLFLSIFTFCTWRPILRQLSVRHSEDYFREQFQPNQDGYVCIHQDTWAWSSFAGTKGLPALAVLAEDKSLAPCGRALARDLHDYLSSGRHLQSFDEMTEHMSWTGKQYMKYLKVKDLEYLGLNSE